MTIHGMAIDDQAALGWTVVLRRQPARIVHGQHEGGYTDEYELVCCECGDDPDLDYREISPVFQRIRGLKMADYASCAPCPHKPHCTRDRGAAFNASGSYTGNDPFVCATAEIAHALADEKARG